jgi:hypothetical protein
MINNAFGNGFFEQEVAEEAEIRVFNKLCYLCFLLLNHLVITSIASVSVSIMKSISSIEITRDGMT